MRRHAPGGEGDFAGKLRLPVPDTFTGQPADWEECAECHGALRLTFRFFKAYIYMFGTGAVTLLERAVRVLFLAVRAESSSSESSHATCGDLCHLVPSLSTAVALRATSRVLQAQLIMLFLSTTPSAGPRGTSSMYRRL